VALSVLANAPVAVALAMDAVDAERARLTRLRLAAALG
jgi:hypothetical protein